MAYDDDAYEKEKRIETYRQMQQDLAELQQREFMKWRDQTIQDEIRKTAEELGLSQADLVRHMSDPGYEKDIRRSTRKLVERASQRVGKPKVAASSTRRERVEPQRRGRPDMEEMKARGRREQLSDDELCELLPRLIR
jgi:hypothetical protein